ELPMRRLLSIWAKDLHKQVGADLLSPRKLSARVEDLVVTALVAGTLAQREQLLTMPIKSTDDYRHSGSPVRTVELAPNSKMFGFGLHCLADGGVDACSSLLIHLASGFQPGPPL